MEIKSLLRQFTLLVILVIGTHCTSDIKSKTIIDANRLVHSDDTPEEWLSYGRNYAETRYSPLEQINASTIDSLGLAWNLIIGTKHGFEATPIVANGIMYFTGPWSLVYAVDAKTGKNLWSYDPKVPKHWGERVCCDVVNRGVAIYEGHIYFGSLDGRLISLNAETGEKVWEVVTVDQNKAYSITGAPRVIKGKVIIGNGGAELGVRGYITAYDAKTGNQDWRFYTVPGNPLDGFEDKAMEQAAETWTGEWWKYGGGGTAWDAMAYDPELNLLYVGTGNGSPWNRDQRSPGGGDNLYLSSIVALNPDSGELEWYYQTTPGDTWDYTATQHIILADLKIKGKTRKVLMQAPKNGFFYVIDRTDGSFISAEKYVYANWASSIDSVSGRPVETKFARYPGMNAQIAPGPLGGHNWQPMAYNPNTGLVYIPAMKNFMYYGQEGNWEFVNDPRAWNTGAWYNPDLESVSDSAAQTRYGVLIAWDPVAQKSVWQVKEASRWNSGVLTSGDLVFKGNGEGEFAAFEAESGKKVWSRQLNTGIIASPITYMIDNTQYVTIIVGWGGAHGKGNSYTEQINPGTVYTFALGKNEAMPNFPKAPKKELINLPFDASPESVANGGKLYGQYCGFCHGGGSIPDLKYSSEAKFSAFQSIVGEGALLSLGMPNFGDRLTEQDIADIKNYLLSEANQLAQLQE